MRVLLINPPSNSPQPIMPLGLACLAASLEQAGIHVEAIDAWAERLDYGALKKRIQKCESPDLIGISVMSPTYSNGVKTIQAAKKACPEAKIIIGGTHPSSLPVESIQENPEVDFVAAGEGDALIVDLAKSLQRKGSTLSNIKGLVYRDDRGHIVNNGHADPIKSLDALPFPARHLFPIFKYQSHPPYRLHKAYATMVTSRGCPFHCTYCTKSVSGQHYRCQSADRVVTEMQHLVQEYGIKQIHFYDDDFTINMKRVEAICNRLLEKKVKVAWSCVTRVDLVNEGLLRKMRQAGCWLISYGVESGNQTILNNVNKGYRIGHIETAFKLTKKTGIRTLGYFMAGLPGETRKTLRDTVRLSFKLEPDFVSWSITALYPGSALYDKAVKGALEDDYAHVKNPVSERAESVSSQSPYAHGHVCMYRGKIPHKDLVETVNSAYRRFYFRIPYMVRFVWQLQTLTEAVGYIRVFLQFMGWRQKMKAV